MGQPGRPDLRAGWGQLARVAPRGRAARPAGAETRATMACRGRWEDRASAVSRAEAEDRGPLVCMALLGPITIIIVIDCRRLRMERNRNRIFK